jgi:hypothetical protein
MKFPCNEHALSEVIGFVLLLVVIITAFSIYLVYAVPAQGRENEILHMNEIRDQFTSYKIGVDALWTNRQLNSAMSTTFNIGSGGASTQGVFSFVPVMNPVPSSGTLSMNQRNETLIVVSRGLIPDGNTVIKETPVMLPATLSSINATPQGFFVRVSDSTPSDWQSGRRSVLVQGLDWSVNVTVNPKTTYYNYSRGCTLTTCNYYDGLWYAGTDITLNVNKSGMMTLEDYVVYENIQNFPANTVFTIDLLDDAYGMKNYLKELQYPISVTFTKSPSSGSISGYGNISFSDEYDRVASHTLALGALEYSIVNNYWIPQTYYYQNGGVFLKQNDGMSIKLPPTITFSYNTTTRVIGVKIIELPFQQANMGNIGGNSPVQVRTQVTNIQNLSYSLTYNNTRWINMSITSSDSQAALAWISALETSANITSGVPREYYSKSVTGTTGHFNISGSDPSGSTYDIHAEGLRANLSATMQGG